MSNPKGTPGEAMEALDRLGALWGALCIEHCGKAARRGIHLDGCDSMVADIETLRASLPAQPVDESRCPSCDAAAWSRRAGVDAPAQGLDLDMQGPVPFFELGMMRAILENWDAYTKSEREAPGSTVSVRAYEKMQVGYARLLARLTAALRPAPGGGPALCPGRFTLPITASACGICGLGWPAHDRQNVPPPTLTSSPGCGSSTRTARGWASRRPRPRRGCGRP